MNSFDPSGIHLIISVNQKSFFSHSAMQLYKQHLPKSDTFCQPRLAPDLTIWMDDPLSAINPIAPTSIQWHLMNSYCVFQDAFSHKK